MKTIALIAAWVLWSFTLTSPAQAWLLHEHHYTAYHAQGKLDEAHAQLLAEAWAGAVAASPQLCAGSRESGEKLYAKRGGGSCVSLGVLTALAADHSCTPAELLEALRKPLADSFVLAVLEQAEMAETRLRQSKSKENHIDEWHHHHLELQIVDPDYLSRAEVNGAHFQLPRKLGESLRQYLSRITQPGAASNAVALYITYHSAALQLASYASFGCSATDRQTRCARDPKRDALFAKAIMAEAFAIHFLQDAFSSGHMMSPTGSRAERMGTHDYYCEHGVAAQTWTGLAYWAHGDSFLQSADLDLVSAAIASSLTDFTSAMLSPAEPKSPSDDHAGFNACQSAQIMPGLHASLERQGMLDTIKRTPQPVLDPPALPQFQEELGLFIAPLLGVAGRLGVAGQARDDWKDWHRFPFIAFGGLGLGGTFEGVTESSTDGVVALGLNFMLDGRPPGSESGIRLGGGLHFHMPYWLVPGDLLLALPLALWSSNEYLTLARRAAAGGAFGLQRKYGVLGHMRLQFMLGREAFLAWLPPPDQSDDPRTRVNEMKTGALSFVVRPSYFRLAVPAVTLTGFHASSDKVGLDAVWQLGYDFTYYNRSEEWVRGAPRGEVHHGVFLAFSYRARRYFYTP